MAYDTWLSFGSPAQTYVYTTIPIRRIQSAWIDLEEHERYTFGEITSKTIWSDSQSHIETKEFLWEYNILRK